MEKLALHKLRLANAQAEFRAATTAQEQAKLRIDEELAAIAKIESERTIPEGKNDDHS